MKLRAASALLIFLASTLAVHAASSSASPSASPTPTLLGKTVNGTLQLLHLKHTPAPANGPQKRGGLELRLATDPSPVTLTNNRQIKVTVTLLNPSARKYVHLNFPTSQRIELLVRDSTGKVVNTWSEDQSFTSDPASVTINPGERLEYTVSVPTREMSIGQPYTLDVSFPSYPDLKISQEITPQK